MQLKLLCSLCCLGWVWQASAAPTTNASAAHDSVSAKDSAPLLLSATLEAERQQKVISPFAGSWMIQLQWLAPEQSVVKAGDPVAVFDAGNLQDTISLKEAEQHRITEELQFAKQDHALKLLEAQADLKRQQLLLQKAQLDAAIPLSQRSRYDYDMYQLQLQRQQTAAEKAAQWLVQVQRTADTEVAKKQLQLQEAVELLAKAQEQLASMKVLAAHDGLISYALHPWYGTKLSAGSSVQPGWTILQVKAADQLFIEAWVHEADVSRLRQAKRFRGQLDAYPEHQISLSMDQLASQGEKKQQWGDAAYYRATFKAQQLPAKPLLLGMGMLVEALP